MSDASLAIEGVTVSYGDGAPVLDAVSLAVSPGEFIALLGASGCGKTTLLRAVSGFNPVRSGRIVAAGRDVTIAPPEQRDMAMVFQSYALWPHMTVAQNVGYGLRLRGQSRGQVADRVKEILGMLKLEGLEERLVTRLSGGQRQRVALGRALAVKPKFLLLDEPLSNLDAQVRLEVRHEIKALQERLGITTLHVTHDREEAMVMADRVVILDSARIAQAGTPEEVYNRPVSTFVAAFMGASNVMPVTASVDGAWIRVAGQPSGRRARLPLDDASTGEGVHVPERFDGPAVLHFRSEAARLVGAGDAPEHCLTLQGSITQSSYPGGFYRYAVAVGEKQLMVDDKRRLRVGDAVGVCLEAHDLHLFPSPAGRGAGPVKG